MSLFESIKVGQLIGKYLAGKESREDLGTINEWTGQRVDNQKLFDSLKEERNLADSLAEFETINKQLAWKRYLVQIDNLSLRKLIGWWKFAAVFFFLMGCTGILVYLVKENSISPVINETYTTISTNYGQNSKLILPDGSVVWVNSGTTLSYNTNFAVNCRRIKLQGQAFFQVAKNKDLPLVVFCNGLNIRVLGTSFDVSAYPDDQNVSVVLESGKVELLNGNEQSVIHILTSGEKADFDTEYRQLSVSRVDLYNYTSWKDGVLIFKNEPMADVLKKLERWYNIDIEVKNDKVYQLIFSATIVNESVEEIFDLMKFSCAINYNIVRSKNPRIPIKVIIYKD